MTGWWWRLPSPLRWHDAGAPGAPCTYDPARLLFDIGNAEIPVEGALVQLDPYHGTTQPSDLKDRKP